MTFMNVQNETNFLSFLRRESLQIDFQSSYDHDYDDDLNFASSVQNRYHQSAVNTKEKRTNIATSLIDLLSEE